MMDIKFYIVFIIVVNKKGFLGYGVCVICSGRMVDQFFNV